MFPYSDWPIQIEANEKHVKKLSNLNKKKLPQVAMVYGA